ncbi:MAG: histidine kinase [Belnapia sp.]|nr:histidine kinase [Belnapia sp.]
MPMTKTMLGRLSVLLLAIGFAALLCTGAGLVWLVETTRNFAYGVEQTQDVRLAASHVLSRLQDAETSQRGYLLTREASYLEPYYAAEEALPRDLPDLARLIAQDGGLPAPPQQLRDLARAKMEELARTIALASSGQWEAALAMVQTDSGKASMDAIRAVVAGIEERGSRRLAARSAGLDTNGRRLLIGAGAAFVLMLGVTLGAAALALRYTRELEVAQAAVVAANGSLERRVAERTEALERASDEVQRFAYIVSHDLRAPLVNVMGFTAELEAALPPLTALLDRAAAEAPALVTPEAKAAVAEDIPEAVGFIRSSTQRMDRLINAILRLSREGRRALQPEMVSLTALMEGLGASLQHQLDAAGATLQVAPGLPVVQTDRVAAEQVFGNLLDNAVKYLDPSRPGRITVRGRVAGTQAVIEVEDNGRGIDPRDHGRIFELFRRSGRQDRPGEGIGLAHVRALARRLGGDVECRSAPGLGSTFRVTLALVAPATPPPAPEELDR